MSQQAAIVMENVRKSFARRPVLKGVTGKIEKGRVVGLLGRNGEGKTTVFRILLDIIRADSGDISVLGQSPDRSGRLRSFVGYVPERPAFHDFMTVGQVLEFRGHIFPGWDGTKALDTASRLNLDLHTRLGGASKGTIAKTAWICATAHKPELLLLDEPTSGLDLIARDSLLTQLVDELAQQGVTIFVANHRMEELASILDEIWVLSGGIISRRQSLESLRCDAVRITARLKQGAAVPPLPIFLEHRSGDLVRWLVLDSNTRDQIQSMDAVEQLEVEPLAIDTALKLLLMKGEEDHV